MTDLIKGEVESNAGNLMAKKTNGKIDVKEHIDKFRAEMDDVGVHEHSLFILFGKDVRELFTTHLACIYPNHVSYWHYSYIGVNDSKWVEGLWPLLDAHSQATKSRFNTLEFVQNVSMRDQLQKLKEKIGKKQRARICY
jgi:hypothetical protein